MNTENQLIPESYLIAIRIFEELERGGYRLSEKDGKLHLKCNKQQKNEELVRRAGEVKQELLELYRDAPTPFFLVAT